MVQLTGVRANFLFSCLSLVSCITVPKNSNKSTRILIASPQLDLALQKLFSDNERRSHSESLRKEILKQKNPPNQHVKRILRHHDVESTLKDDIKPIYEPESGTYTDSPSVDHFTGYFYDQPNGNKLKILGNHDIEGEDSLTSDKVVSALTTIDHIFKPLLKFENYNSPLHIPTSPILALILSQYGKYIPSKDKSYLYSYMATNNIHNHRPFGQYKYEYGEN